MPAEFPTQIITNTETRAVTLTPEIEATLPGIDQAFTEADKAFLDDPEKYLSNLENSVFMMHSSEGSDVACSLLYGPDSKQDELLVIFAPFSDRSPKSSAEELYEYITADTAGGLIGKEKAAPNSWSQTTKSAVIFELLGALGKNIPVLTIYSPIPTHAYSFGERAAMRSGDFSPAARIAKEAIAAAQSRLHGAKSETQIDTAHLYGASLGASNAISAGHGLIGSGFNVPTVSAQEAIIGPDSLPDLGKRFTVSQYTGEPSDETVSRNNPKIEEPAIRKAVDMHGSEPIGMNARTVKAMKPTYMLGLTKPDRATAAVERLLDDNVELLVALADNSSITNQTHEHLPNGGEKIVRIRGENGQRIGHLADEHVALSALVPALNIARSRKQP